MNYEYLIPLGIALAVFTGLYLMLLGLRRRTMRGEVVGINFSPGLTLNRTIIKTYGNGKVVVLNPECTGQVAVSMDKIYFPQRAEVDKPYNHRGGLKR